MNKEFNKKWTSKFVRAILKKFEANPRKVFLCEYPEGSFARLWKEYHVELLQLAWHWLQDNPIRGVKVYTWMTRNGALFIVNQNENRFISNHGVRVRFLKSEIARLSALERINKKKRENARFRRVWNKKNIAEIIKSMTLANESYICYGSHLFRSIWQNHKTKLFKLAKNFLKENNIRGWKSNQREEPILLFCSTPLNGCALSRRDIRMKFLRYELKRLSNKRV